MGGASADRDFLFTGKERRKTHQIGTAIKSSKGKGVFVLSVIATERTTIVMYGLFLSPKLG